MNTLISFLFLVLFSIIKCQESEPTDEFDPNNLLPPNKRRPTHFPEKAYCDTCIHVMGVAAHQLAGKTNEMDIIDLLDTMFNREEMHKYIPDKVRIFAEHFISVYEEDIIHSLKIRQNEKHAIYLACYQFSQVYLNKFYIGLHWNAKKTKYGN